MIKFFRQIRQRLLSEGKTTKYIKYSIGEIILVVIGILMALSVNNWNAEKGEQKRAKLLIQNLAEEIEQDSIYLSEIYKAEKETFLSSAELLFKIHSNENFDEQNDTLIGMAFRVSCFTPVIKYSNNVYKELTSSNLFEQLESKKLKQLIHKYYGQLEFLNKYSEQNNQISNDLIEQLANYYEILPNSESKIRSSIGGASEEYFEAKYDLEAFKSDRSLNPKLYDMIDIHKDRLGGLEIVRDLRNDILHEIEASLSN